MATLCARISPLEGPSERLVWAGASLCGDTDCSPRRLRVFRAFFYAPLKATPDRVMPQILAREPDKCDLLLVGHTRLMSL
jgi:hypothetical protein